jgi:peptidase M1-like protein
MTMCRSFGPVLLAVVVLLSPCGAAVAAPDLYAAVLPDLRDAIVAKTEGELSTYTLDVRLDPAASTIGGRERLTFVNRFDTALDDVEFRLYPNADYYGEGGTTVDDVRVAGAAATASLEVGETVLRVPLAEPVKPGGSVKLSFRFRTVIPTDSSGTFGILSHDTAHGTWVLADWYPIVAGYESGSGWYLAEPTSLGDPTFSDAALYDVTVTAPTGLTLVATGSAESHEASDGDGVTQFESGPVREFTLVADDDYRATSTTVDGTRITMYVNPDAGTAGGARLALATAASALHAYSVRYGRYPYEELDLVETDLSSSVLAVSWSGLIFLEGPDFLANAVFVSDDPTRLDFTVAHEVGHQWWGAMIGANSNDHTFMVEGLTNALATVYVEDTQGKDAARREIQMQLADRYLEALANTGDGVVDLPVGTVREGPQSGVLDYGKAALGFLAIRETVGDDAFFAGLADYAARFSYRNATPDDLRAAFERASGMDLSDLWRFWFNEAETTRAAVEQVLAGT